MSKGIAFSELTGKIYWASVNKNGVVIGKKQDITGEACAAVLRLAEWNMEHLPEGKTSFKITADEYCPYELLAVKRDNATATNE